MNKEKVTWEVCEIFYSIQGEGFNTGLPSIFIRLSGCNLDCSFCDTDHSNAKTYDKESLLQEIEKYDCKNILITGGEPTLQNIEYLVNILKEKNYWISIETNGTGNIPEKIDWITVSPKTEKFLQKGNELKLIYQGQDLKKYENLNYQHLYLQPCSEKNIPETVEAVKSNTKWKLSVQVHKLIGIK